MAKKSFLKKTEKNKYSRKKGINFLKVLWQFFLLVFIGVIGYVFLFSGFLNILNREFSPTEKIDSQRLSGQLNALLKEKYLRVVSKNNLLLLKENYLNNLFTQEFGIVKKIKIIKQFPDKIKIIVEERNPVLVLENSQGKFILDDEGNAYPYNFFDSSGFDQTELPILKEENSELAFSFDNQAGSKYLQFIFGVKEKLENLLDIPVEKEMKAPKIISGDVIFKTQEGWQIYFNEKVAINKEIEMLRIVLEEKVGKEKKKDLEYIDLRIDNKVYYKFKDIQLENTPVEKTEDKNKKKK